VLLQRDASPFQKVLAKFLTTNTLQTVCPWLQHIVGEEITPACVSQSPDDPPAFGYCLPLYTVNAQPLSTFMQLNPDARAVERIFGVPVGFFWETVETGDDECFPDPLTSDNSSGGVDGGFETAVMLVSNGLFRSGKALMAITGRTVQAGLSLAGVRLLYPTAEQAGTCPLKLLPRSKTKAADASHGPVLAVALRGFEARTAWLDAVGPFDPVLARRIDPTSLCALYGGDSRDACRIYCPRNPYQTTAALVRWFGGRVPDSRVIAVGESPSRPRAAGKSRKSRSSCGENRASVRPHGSQAAMLCAATRSDIFVAVSPLVASRCLALVLCICQQRGYMVCGVRRLRLAPKTASHLGEQMLGFRSFFLFSLDRRRFSGVQPVLPEANFWKLLSFYKQDTFPCTHPRASKH